MGMLQQLQENVVDNPKTLSMYITNGMIAEAQENSHYLVL